MRKIYLVFYFSMVALVLLARTLVASISHDEYQFVASAQLLVSKGMLPYLDYHFLHMPYLIPINALAVALSPYDLLATRLMNELFHLFGVALLFWLSGRLMAGVGGLRPPSTVTRYTVGSLSGLLLVFESNLLIMDGRVFNHAHPVALTLAAVAFYLLAQQSSTPVKGRWPKPAPLLLLSGVAAGLATGIRLSFAVVPVVFSGLLALELLLARRSGSTNRWRAQVSSLLSYLGGVGLAMLPVVLLALANPMAFFVGNFLYIRMNTVYRQAVGYEFGMSFASKLDYLWGNFLVGPTKLLILFTLLVSTVLALKGLYRWLFRTQPDENGQHALLRRLLLCGLSWALIAAGFAPTPLWAQYFYAPVPLMILVAVDLLAETRLVSVQRAGAAVMVAVFLLSFPLKATITSLSILPRREAWVPLQVHHFSQELAALLPAGGQVLTTGPIYPLEAGLEIYPPFTVGSFIWRASWLFSPERRQLYNLLAYPDLEAYLASDPPDAIITDLEIKYDGFGYYGTPHLEDPFIEYAQRHGYQVVYQQHPDFWINELTIWVK